MRRFLVVCWLILGASPSFAQEKAYEDALGGADIPREIVGRLAAFLSDSATTRFTTGARVAPGEVVRGGVAVTGGPATVAGRVEGDLVVIRADLDFEPGGAVAGDVTVVCGTARGTEAAEIGGTLTVYDRAFCDSGREEGVWWSEREPRRERRRRDPDVRDRLGDSRFAVRTGGSYNRVEGLPLAFGPIIETSGSNPLRLEALAVWRTESAFDSDELGYSVRLEQFLGGHRSFRLGGVVRSLVQPIEGWGVGDLEASLSAALFREDLRDYFERTGWGAYARWTPPVLPLDASLEYRDEEHRALAAGDPWSLFGGDRIWRAQPLVAEGGLRSLAGQLRLDTRDHDDEPSRGWLLDAQVVRGLDGALATPATIIITPGGETDTIAGLPVDSRFTTAVLDLRRYNRVGFNSLLNFRVVAGGSLTGERLPPQFQHALGGLGSLPGYDLFHGDCGARLSRATLARDDRAPRTFFPFYGCDRFALFQAEYIGEFGIDFDFFHRTRADDDWNDWWNWDIDLSPTWVAFFDAGRGWAQSDFGAVTRGDTPTFYDAGLGLLFGDLGIYAAVPLREADREVNIFLRLGRRF